MNNPTHQEIFNYALDNAVKNNDVGMAEKCLSEGSVITSKTVSLCTPIHKTKINGKLLILLLQHGFETIVNDVNFMDSFFKSKNEHLIRLIIEAGYNGSYNRSAQILKSVVEKKKPNVYILSQLLENGFDEHIQFVLMGCIEKDNHSYLPILLKHGANFYSRLNDICEFGLHYRLSTSVEFAINHMYDINMLSEPIFKYCLFKSTQFDLGFTLPIEICAYVFQLFMEPDYIRTNLIRRRIDVLRLINSRRRINSIRHH